MPRKTSLQPAGRLATGSDQTGRRSHGPLLIGSTALFCAILVPQSRIGVQAARRVIPSTADQKQPVTAEQPVIRLADTILYVGRSGDVSEEGRRVLGLLWRDLDPRMALLPKVTTELNRRYAQQYEDYLKTWSMLGEVARLFCWEFAVTEETVRHFLDGNDVPESRVVRWLGLDLGATIAHMVRLGEGGETRGRFQLRVLASLPPKSTTWRDLRVLGCHLFTLYATLLVAHYAQAVVTLTTLSWIIGIEGMRRCTEEGMSIRGRFRQAASTAYQRLVREPVSTALAVLGFFWVVDALEAWREVMLPRVALLTTSIHGSLIEQGYLREGDCLNFCDTPIVEASVSFLDACRRTAIWGIAVPAP